MADGDRGAGSEGHALARGQLLLLAITGGVSVANLYYLQPLLALVGRELGASVPELGSIPMLTQLGYALGLVLFVPLGDVLERRGLMVWLLGAVTLALCAVGFSTGIGWLRAASFGVGLTTVVPQVAVPLAAHLAAPNERGRAIGIVMGGILIGILLARTVSGVLGAHLGWRTVYFLAGGIMIGLAATLRFCLPRSRPEKTLAYPALLRSLWPIARQEPVLREAALVGAAGFGAFSVFWTTLVFWLEGPAFGLGSQAAGLFGLFGVAGALAASLGGRLTDRYSRKAISAAALVLGLLSFGLLAIAGRSLVGLGAGVVLLDLGVQLNHVANLARVHALAPEARSRLNTLYMVTYFFGGAAGTGLGAWAWSRHGWPGVCAAGALFCLAGLARLAGAPRRHSGRCVPERSAP